VRTETRRHGEDVRGGSLAGEWGGGHVAGGEPAPSTASVPHVCVVTMVQDATLFKEEYESC